MHKFLLALTLLCVPASTRSLAHRGTDQEQQACTRDVQRFCRKLMDQGDFTILACLKENRPKLSPPCRSAMGNSERSIEEDRSCPDPNAEEPASERSSTL
jgi:hypothetical protein